MKISVTGATGFVGNNVVRQLVSQGHEVYVLVRQSSDPRPLDGLAVNRIEGDLTDPQALRKIVEPCDALIHSAALIRIGWSELEKSRLINVIASENLAHQCRLAGIRMIHVSTIDTLAAACKTGRNDETHATPPKTPCSYVVSKSEAEQAVLREVSLGLDAVVVNPSFMVGPWDWKPSSGQMMLAIASQIVPFTPGGGCSVVDVRSVAAGLISAIEKARTGERYIMGGENMTYLDLWRLMAKVTRRLPPLAGMPNWFAEIVGRVGDATGKLIRREPVVNSAATRMGQLYHYYNSSKAIKELNYEPGPVRPALEDAWTFFQEYDFTAKRKRKSARS